MVFKIASSSGSDSFSVIGMKQFLIISFEDQVCLDCIPGWESKLPEENGHADSIAPPLLPAEKALITGIQQNPPSAEVQCALINGDKVDTVKRKTYDHLAEDASQKSKDSHSDTNNCQGHSSATKHQRPTGKKRKVVCETSTALRPRSLPDFSNRHVGEELGTDNEISVGGGEPDSMGRHEMESVYASRTGGNLVKGISTSRSLNNISDIQSPNSSLRSRPGVPKKVIGNVKDTGPRFSPSPDAASNEKQSVTSRKNSCARRLNLDGPNAPLQSTVGMQPLSIHKETLNVEPCTQKPPANLSSKRRQLGSFSKTSKSHNRNSSESVAEQHATRASSTLKAGPVSYNKENPNILPEASQLYRLGPETQHVLMNNFGEDSFCVSERSRDGTTRPKASVRSVRPGVEIPRDSQKDDGSFEIVDADIQHTSEELFDGSQHGVENSVRQNELQGSQRAGSEHHFENLGVLFSILHRGSQAQLQDFRFTGPQIKSMCEVLSRLYNL